MTTAEEKEKGFSVIVEATSELILAALGDREFSPMAGAAVLQSALLLEAAANCCVNELKLSARLADELDRLPTLTKYDLFILVRSSGKTMLDRGAALYQDVRELKSIRDSTVHPKWSHVTWTQVEEDRQIGTHKFSPRLNLCLVPFQWSCNDALVAFKAVHNFLSDFFLVQCGLDAIETRKLLLAPIGNEEIEDIFLSTAEMEALQEKHGVDLSYLGVGHEE